MLIDRRIIEDINARTDIVDVIGSYVTLKRAGSNYNGLCPFHTEKTPSFTVFPSSQSFYCFGCNAGGDAITFIMKEDNLDYVDAVRQLAARAGVTVPEDSYSGTESGASRRRILEMNREAARFFHSCLMDERLGAPGRDYIFGKRKLSPATVNHFGIGYSPDSFGMLTDHLRKKGYTDEELVAGFLCGKSQKNGRLYDYFKGRVIFPIIDSAGNVVAFGGRDITGNDARKYLNTSDTPAFKKGRNLFALNFAKNHGEDCFILCEGYMDVIALHSAGFENAVATLGTALTDDQARLFTKYTKKIVLLYDSDDAGQRATRRALPMLANAGLEVRVLKLAGAKDPDEFIREKGAEEFGKALKGSSTGFEYKINNILAKYDMSDAGQKIRASGEICQMISEVWSKVEREVYIEETEKRIGISADSLRSDIDRLIKKHIAESRKNEGREALMSARAIGDRTNPDAAKNIRANAAEEVILGLMMLYPEHRKAIAGGEAGLVADDFMTVLGRKIFEKIIELETTGGGYSYSLMGEYFNDAEMGRMQRMQQRRRELTDNGAEVLRQSIAALKAAANEAASDQPENKLSDIRKTIAAKKKSN